MQTDPPTRINMTSGATWGSWGVALFAAGACTMGVPYTCVQCVRVSVCVQSQLQHLHYDSFAVWAQLSTVSRALLTVWVPLLMGTGHSASHNSDTCRPAGEYRSETKTGREKAKTNRGTTAVVWYNLENAKQRQVSFSLTHTHVRTLRRMQTKQFFLLLCSILRVSRLVSSWLFYHFCQVIVEIIKSRYLNITHCLE